MIKFTLNVYDPHVYCVHTVAQPSPLSFQNVFITPRKTPSHPLPTPAPHCTCGCPSPGLPGLRPPLQRLCHVPGCSFLFLFACPACSHPLSAFQKVLDCSHRLPPRYSPGIIWFPPGLTLLAMGPQVGRQAGRWRLLGLPRLEACILWPLCPVSERIRWFSAWECPSSERPLERD